MEKVALELAEFDENEEGKIGMPPRKARRLHAELLDRYVGASIDDCGEGSDDAQRSFQATLDLVRAQAICLEAKTLAREAFQTIKIDSVPAFAAFNKAHPNPRAPAPTEQACAEAAEKLNKFVEDVWRIAPRMNFVVEATAITREELNRVPALDPSDSRVSFQGCHLRAQAFLVADPKIKKPSL